MCELTIPHQVKNIVVKMIVNLMGVNNLLFIVIFPICFIYKWSKPSILEVFGIIGWGFYVWLIIEELLSYSS